MLARRPVIALVVALVLWATTLKAFVHGAIGVFDTAVRFLIAFAVAWVAVTILGIVTAGYGNAGVDTDPGSSAPADPGPRRRRTDVAPDGVVDVTGVTEVTGTEIPDGDAATNGSADFDGLGADPASA